MSEDIPQTDTSDRPSVSTGPDSLMKCRYCGRNLEKFFALGSVFCPFCGAAINANITSGKPKKDSNILTGRAPWPLRESLLVVLLSMLIFLGVTISVMVIIILIIVFSNISIFLANPTALVEKILQIFQDPTATALLSLLEFSLLILPFFVMRKYRRSKKDRFLLLGWKPYFGVSEPSRGGWPRFLKDVGISAIFAMALVGFMFMIDIANTAMWAPFFPSALDLSDADQSLTPTNVFQLILLVAVMLFAVAPSEESLFRGFSQQGLESRIGEKKAWFISSVIFAFVHVFELLLLPMTIPLFLPNFLPYLYLSMALCAIYWKTKNLNRMILIHGIYDSLIVVYSSIPTTQGSSILSPSDWFVLISIGFCIIFASFLLIKWLKVRKASMPLITVKAQGS